MIIDAKKYNKQCSCGRQHQMFTEMAVIEAGCLRKFDEYREQFFPNAKSVVAVYDQNTYQATKEQRLKTEYSVVLPAEDLHANEIGCEMLLSKLPKEADLLVAVGAGTIHDITRYCAYQKGISFISCPTAASVDGFCSSVAAMTWKGYKKTFTAVAPKLVLADLDVISQAPMRLTRSGFGDMVGKYIALADWGISNVLRGEFLCENIYNITLQATKTVIDCVDGLIKNDQKAYEQLIYGLLMSGLSMQLMGNSRPASGAEHHISHFIEMEPVVLNTSSKALHGEKVGVATLLVAQEYHNMISSKIEWKDFAPVCQEKVFKIFGKKLASSILEENQQNCALGITSQKLYFSQQKICQIVKNIPKKEELIKKYQLLGAKTTLGQIGVNEQYKGLILQYSPLVRNRLTLMRLRQTCINLE